MREDVLERRRVLVPSAVPICDRTPRPLRGELGGKLLIRSCILGGKLLGLVECKRRPHGELRGGAVDTRHPYVLRAEYVRVEILISLQNAVRGSKAFENSAICPLHVFEHFDEVISHWLRMVLGSAIVSGERAASRHRANNAKNALSHLRSGDDSLSTAIAKLVSVPSRAPPNTSDG